MSLAENIKTIREEKNLKQIEVATHIGVDKSAYSKIEKGSRNVTVDELYKMGQLFKLTLDQIVAFEGSFPKEITIEDKTAVEQMNLIAQLEEEDKQTIFKLIDKMLTKKSSRIFSRKMWRRFKV